MKNRAFRKFVASIGVAAMVMSTATNALSPAVAKAESAQELEGQQNDSQEQGGQEDPVAQSSDDANGAPFADAEPMAVSSDDSQNSQEAAGPSESSDSNGENGAEGSSGENTNASAGSTSIDASGAESQGAAGTMSGATNGAAGTTNSTIPGTTETAGTMSGATNATSANGTSANTSTDAANGTSADASTGTTTGENGEASGDNAEASTKEITSVITEDIDLGTYPAGEAPAYAQLELPDEIEVKVDEEKQIVTVTWNGEETYHPDQAGTYIFSSELDKEWNKDENGNARYRLAEKVELPKASVRVEKKAESKEENKTDVKSDNKTENKTDAKLDNKTDSKTDAKADSKSEGKTEEKSDSKSEVTTKPETTKDTSKETAKDTSKDNTKETSKKDSTSKDKTKDETKGETKDKTKDETKAETKTDAKDEPEKADQKKKVTNAAALKAVYVAEDGTILCGTVGLTGDSFTIYDKAKSFNGYELKTVTLGEEELPQDTAFTRNTSTTETKEEIRTEASYTYTMDGAEHEIAAGDTATITFTYAQKEEVTPEIASIEVTGEAVDTTGAAIQGDYAFPLAVGTNDLSKTAPYIQGYEYQYAEIGTDKITSIDKEVLEAGKYAYYVDGELLKENTKITYVYQEDEDYTKLLTGTCGNLTVTVSAKKDAKIPEGTIVRVSPIESARMSQIMAKISETLGQDPDNVIGVLYDISLDKDGEEIQPRESVHVTMKFDGGIPWNVPEGKQIADTKVVHMHGGETDVVAEAAEDGNAEFETESFSPYGSVARVAAKEQAAVTENSTPLSLNEIVTADGIQVTTETTNSKRDATLEFHLTYTIDNEKLNGEIKKTTVSGTEIHNVWEYDLTEFMQQNPLMNLSKDGSGDVMDGSTVAGHYNIDNNKLILTIDSDWLNSKNSGVSGGLSFKAQLDSEKIGTEKEVVFRFPGTGASTKVTFEDVSVTNKKTAGDSQWNNGQSWTDGGKQFFKQNEDGSYTIYYKVETTTNAALDSLILHDTVSDGQNIDLDTVQVYQNNNLYQLNTPANVNVNCLTVDLSKSGEKIPAGTYTVTYTTTVPADQADNALTNSAYWSFDGDGKSDKSGTNFKIKKELKVQKEVTEDTDAKGRTKYTYTITIGDGSYSLGGHEIKDWMSDNQSFAGDFTISAADDIPQNLTSGKLKETMGDGLKDDAYTDNSYQLFNYTFPDEYNGKGPVTIIYSTIVDDTKKGDLSGNKNITNKTTDEHDKDYGEDSTSKAHNFGEKRSKGSIEKKGVKIDTTNPEKQLAEWIITVKVNPSVELPAKITVYGNEWESYGYYGVDQYNTVSLPIDWDNVSVDGKEKDKDYVIDKKNKSIVFDKYNDVKKSITIHLSSLLDNTPLVNDKGEELRVYNKAYLKIEDQDITYDDDTLKYVANDYGFSKGVQYDKEKDVYNWTVKINPGKAHVDPDKHVIFKDTLPTGMELVPESFIVQYEGKDSENNDFWADNWAKFNIGVSLNGSEIDLCNSSLTNWNTAAPCGISGVSFTICYQTRLTEEEKQKNGAASSTPKKYTNHAYVKKDGEDSWKETSTSIERQYNVLDKKDLSNEDLTTTTKNVISYQIDINKEKATLNNGQPLVLTDTLPEGTDLVRGTGQYTIRDEQGNAISNSTLSYDSLSRIITVTVPDATYAIFDYKIIVDTPTGNDGKVFSNKAKLKGNTIYEVTTEKKHIVVEGSSYIGGNNNEITIQKYDLNDPNRALKGAEFELYTVDQNNCNLTKVGETLATGNDGKLTFQSLNLVDKDSTNYTLYCFKETKAPAGYVIGNNEYNNGYYFILYKEESGDKEKATEFAKTAKEKLKTDIHVLRGGHEVSVGNEQFIEGEAILQITKAMSGRALTDNDKFEFQLKDKDGNVLQTKENTGSTVVFDALKYGKNDAGKTYTYTIHESSDKKSEGITNGADVTATVKVSEGTDHKIQTEVSYTNNATITNTYTARGSATFHAHKTLAGATLEAGKFSFVLKKGNEVVATGTNDAAGNVTFHAAEKTEEYSVSYTLNDAGKEDTYTISEVKPENADSHLTYDETVYTVTVTPTDGGNGTLTATPVYSKEGQEGTEDRAEFVNTYTTEGEAILQITKAMSGRALTDNDKFEFQLKDKDGNVLQTKENTGSTVVFDALKYGKNDAGKTYTYTIHESSDKKSEGITNGADVTATVKVSEGTDHKIQTEVSYTNNATITNTYTPEKVQVSGSKNWNDDGNAAGTRPGSITIRLYANGSEIDHKTVTEKEGWSWNWTGLNRYDTDHKEISYTISEDAVDGYTSSISGYNVTNTVNKPQVGSVILTKVDATTGTALAGAVFDLYRANNTKVGTYTTNAGGVLRVDGLTFGDYYFVETKAPEGYALESQRAAFTINAATTVSAPASVRVTNKPVDEKIGVSAAKVWDDENNTDGVRPSSVTFRLFADGVEIGSAQASEANGWTVSFGNLPKTRNGVAISYAVKEDEVGNYYEASYETGLGSDGSYVFTVKNYRETDKHYEERTGSVRGANRNKPSNGGVAGAGRGRGTGDESDMTVYGTVSGASLFALIVWMIARRKRAGKGTK